MAETLWKQKMNQFHTCLETTLIRFWETEKYRQMEESLQHVYSLTNQWYFLYLLPFPQSSPKIRITRPITSSLVRTWLPLYLPPNLHPTVSSEVWGVRHRRMMLAFAIVKIIGDFCIAKSTVSSQSSRLLTDIQQGGLTTLFLLNPRLPLGFQDFDLLILLSPCRASTCSFPSSWSLNIGMPQASVLRLLLLSCSFCRGSYQIPPSFIDDFQICLQSWLLP